MSCPRCNAPAADETLREFGGVCPKCLLDFSEEQDAPAFPNLEILEMLGQGGMGVVYKAVQKNLGRTVALKVLSPHLSADPEFVERFTREARALASLSHPNIVGIYDSGIHDHVPYLVMEYVDGTPLRKMLASKKLSAPQVLEVIPQICDALHYAHANGVVHRDIKPENILVDRQGRVKIADFGLAKLASLDETRITKTGYVMGSPHYMAPEQFVHSGRVDHRADIYSLGVVFYEMLTGEVPMGRFKAPSEKASVDQRLDPVVLKSLEREPDDRWQSVDEVKERVTRLDVPSSEATLVWNGIPILITLFLNPKVLYTAAETTVYVDGRKLGSSCSWWIDRVLGSFQDREGRSHTLDVTAGMGVHYSTCKVQIDGTLVWQGDVPIQNLGYGYSMVANLAICSLAELALAPRDLTLLLATGAVEILIAGVLVLLGLKAVAARVRPAPAPDDRTKLVGVAIWGISIMAIGLIAQLTFAKPMAAAMGTAVVLFGGGSILFLLRRSYRSKQEPLPTPPPNRNEERNTRIAVGISSAIAVLAIAVIFYLLKTRPNDAVGGPVLVIVTGVVLSALAATHFRFWKSKTRGMSPDSLRRQSIATAAAAAAMVLIGIVILLFAVAPAPAPTPPQAVATKQVLRAINPATNLPQRLPEDPDRFLLRDAWPSRRELPPGMAYDQILEGEQAARYVIPVPEGDTTEEWRELLSDVTLLRCGVMDNADLILTAVEFKTEAARRRWEKELPLHPVPFADGFIPKGLSLFDLSSAWLSRKAESRPEYAPLLRVVQKKMADAALAPKNEK